MKKVTCVELPVFERMTPLATGYLHAYAQADQAVRHEYLFEHYTAVVRTAREKIIKDLIASDADVYAFSCYVWNMGLVKLAVAALRAAKPHAQVILGGPQVMRQADRYLRPADESVVICDGEGEITFTEYLRELTERRPDLMRVNGLSCYRDGELITTQRPARISNLDEIPSPFLTGIFEAGYSMSVIETNRGCPFRCAFCFWGAATNDKVYRFAEQRVRDEITWLAKHEILFLYIADANWGMLSRDIDLSQHIAECAGSFGTPSVVYFSAAKNKPHGVTKIASIFQDAGLVASQPVSLQTIEPRSLALIARTNIKLSAFAAVQNDLRDKGISSFIELIWPLPGETLDTFRQGIGKLCENEAQTVITYPHLLLNNTPLYHDAAGLGLLTREAGGSVGEARVVIQTKEVSAAEFAEGMRYFYAVHALHNTRSLRTVSRYLVSQSILGYASLFSAFADFWTTLPADDPIAGYVERSIRDADYYDINNYGLFIHLVLHEYRRAFDHQLYQFARSQAWWDENTVRPLFELDLLNRPYVYSNTAMEPLGDYLQTVHVADRGLRSYTVLVPPEYLPALADSARIEAIPADGVFLVDHKRMQYPFMASQSIDHNASYCHGMIEKIENIVPIWRALGPAVSQ
jgi:tRNA A37 methylthiotransferase MiaB